MEFSASSVMGRAYLRALLQCHADQSRADYATLLMISPNICSYHFSFYSSRPALTFSATWQVRKMPEPTTFDYFDFPIRIH